MKITKVETVVYRNVTQVHAGGIGWTWVRIHTDTGAYGWGETFPAPDSEKAVILSDYAPVLLGRDPRDIERLWLPPDGFKNLQVRRRHGQMPARKMRDRPATVMGRRRADTSCGPRLRFSGLPITRRTKRHLDYNDRFLPVVAASGAPQNGRLGVPPGPGLGVVIREEFLRSGKVEIDFVDEGTADRSRVVWRRGESMSPKGRMVAPSLAKQRRKRKGRSIGLQEGWWRKTEIVFMFQPRFLWAACSPATIS
jgi:hypothetical protein